ncbi:hypothetical protein LEMLEM_LOCUS7694, partial [Lemmus lemmus]
LSVCFGAVFPAGVAAEWWLGLISAIGCPSQGHPQWCLAWSCSVMPWMIFPALLIRIAHSNARLTLRMAQGYTGIPNTQGSHQPTEARVTVMTTTHQKLGSSCPMIQRDNDLSSLTENQ